MWETRNVCGNAKIQEYVDFNSTSAIFMKSRYFVIAFRIPLIDFTKFQCKIIHQYLALPFKLELGCFTIF